MENTSTSTFSNATSPLSFESPRNADSSPDSKEDGELGNLDGIPVEAVETSPRTCSAITDHSSSPRALSSAHRIELIESRPSVASFSPCSSHGSHRSLESIQDSKIVFQNNSKAVIGYDENSEAYQQYGHALSRARAVVDSISDSVGEVRAKFIDSHVQQIAQLHDWLREGIEQNKSSLKILNEAQQAIGHYTSCIQRLKELKEDPASDDTNLLISCRAHQCFSRFKELDAYKKDNEAAAALYFKSYSSYRHAVEATNYKDRFLLKLTGDSFFNAADQLQQGEEQISQFYLKAGNYFQEAIKNSKEDEQGLSALSEEMGNHCVSAAEAMLDCQPKLVELYQDLHKAMDGLMEAVKKQDAKTHEYFESSVKMHHQALEEFETKGETNDFKQYRSVAQGFYLAGEDAMAGRQEIAELGAAMAQCQNEALSQTGENENDLALAGQSFFQARAMLQEGNKKIAALFKKAGEYFHERTLTTDPVTKKALQRASVCYQNIARLLENNVEEDNLLLQRYRSAAAYGDVVLQEMKSGGNEKNQAILQKAATHLFIGATTLEEGNEELADIHATAAASYHHLALAREPALFDRFPEKFQRGMKKESAPNASLIRYWEQAIKENDKKVRALYAKSVEQNKDHELV